MPRVFPRAAALAAACALIAAVPAAAQDELKPENPVGPVSYHGWKYTTLDKDAPEPQSSAAPYAGEAVVAQPYYVGREAAEPTLGVDRDGSVFYAASAFDALGTGALAHTQILRSDDGGLTWNNTTFAAGGIDIPPTTLDPYTYVDAKTSRVFSIDLAGAGSFLVYSDDKGQNWRASAMSSPGVNDHQTFFTGPPPDANPLVTTQDNFPNVAYYCVNQLSDSGCSYSVDGGATFRPMLTPPFITGSKLHGHGVVDSAGRVFLPRGSGPPQVAITEDAGNTWDVATVADEPTTSEPHTAVAVDAADNVYYVWYDGQRKLPYLSVSRDHGTTWSRPLMIAPPGVHDVNFPMVTAGDAGKIAISFPGSSVDDQDDATRPWHAWFVVSTNALDADPLFVAGIADPGNDPLHRGTCDGRCSGMFDFIDLQISPKDGSVWGTFTDTCTPANDCPIDRSSGLANDAQGVAVHQLFGPRLVGDGSLGGGPVPIPIQSGPIPSSPSARDTTKPRVLRLRVKRRTLRWKLSERASVRIVIRRGRRAVVRLTTGRPTSAGKLKLKRKKIKRGRYTISVRPTDAAGNRGKAKKLRYRFKK